MFGNVHPWLIPLAFFYLIIIPVGIFSNVIMIICFFVNPRLRSPFHILLTLTCLADGIHVCGQIIFVFQMLTNTYSYQSTCYMLNVLPVIGLTLAAPLLMQIGLDRLLAVSFPIRYRELQFQKLFYTSIHLIFPILYTISILYLGFLERNNEQVKCAIPTALAGISFKVFTLSSHAIYVSIILAYLMTAILLKFHDTSSRFKAVFKSIGVTVGIVLFGWAITTVSNTFGLFVTDDMEVYNLIQMYSGITVNIAISSNLIIFYTINPEYQLTVKMLMDGTCGKLPTFSDSASELQNLRKNTKSQET
ncbi:G-protein coupled receptors family 1 profile domain-containing protein [Caenorhabditis elegans]|uniref:G-protein coupled receptors family 1 profile domain-containing protein n=1 Tax=Caenorhabditis elegans TaxID=6239 RepID=Q18767_CAEEL|nr:G-protein coupled receptors family 1 profile domain-containing protein [Caenorhabditis elegans]CAB01637.2 G-protein coupled receptors family 1 profile domain-containing protein [Caenorhabditis elegans]|eukprot:NP_505612.2 Serpentine Receptor, class SX [Caenorhabditis elegans]